jgi:predicted kinase
LSSRDLLIETGNDGEFVFNSEMLEFIRAIKNKYRVYLLTKISKKEGEDTHDEKEKEAIHELLMKLVKQDIIKGKHRLMYSSTESGHIAQIRHLASDLHLECKFLTF